MGIPIANNNGNYDYLSAGNIIDVFVEYVLDQN